MRQISTFLLSVWTAAAVQFISSPVNATPYTIEVFPDVTCTQRTTHPDPGPAINSASMLCDVQNSTGKNDPSGIGVGNNPRVGWFLGQTATSSWDHFRTYMVFEVDDSMRHNAINSAYLRFYIRDIQREGRISNDSRLKVVYSPTFLSSAKTYLYSRQLSIPALFSGDIHELSVEGSLRVDGQSPILVNILPLIQQAIADSRVGQNIRFVLAITISPEDNRYTTLGGAIFSAPPAISGFSIIPRQQLSLPPAIVLDFEATTSPQTTIFCGDLICHDYLGETCPADCRNGEQDGVPPVIEVGVETMCTGGQAGKSLKNSALFNGLTGFGGLSKILNGNTSARIFQDPNMPRPCVQWYSTATYPKEVISVPIFYWEGGSPYNNPQSKLKKIFYRVYDDHRLAKVWIRSDEVSPNPESITFYNSPLSIYPPSRAPNALTREVTLRCGLPTDVTFSAWDFAPNSSQLTVRFEVKGDGQAPLIRARQSDGHIVRSNYDSANRRYKFYAGDTLLYDFEIVSTDEIQSWKVELDGQIINSDNLDECDPNSLRKVSKFVRIFNDNIPAFSDREGWRTGAPGSAVRNLKITVTDVEGQTTVQNIPLELVRQSIWSSWDKVDPGDREFLLEQEGFFVNWANGPGYMTNGLFDGSLSEIMSLSDVPEYLLFSLKMFFQTYGVTDGAWSAASLLSPAARTWYNNPWHLALWAISYPIYNLFLVNSSAWCSGYSMAFQLWRRGDLNWTDFDSCEKLDINGNHCSSTSPPNTYCHINCCRERNDENKCIDGVADNDVMQYIGAMQGKMFTGEFMGKFVVRAAAAVTETGGQDVTSAVDDIEDGGSLQGNEGGKIFDKVVTMFGGINSLGNIQMAHSIAPVRSQKLADGVHRVYVYDPNKEQLSYGMKCIDGRFSTKADWQSNCGTYLNDDHYSGVRGPLTVSSGEMDPIGGSHRETLDYILLMKKSFFGAAAEQFHFNEYQGGDEKNGFMFYIEPQYYHGNPFVLEGWLMFMVGVVGTIVEMALDELFDVDFEDIEGYIDSAFASAHDLLVSAWDWLTDWKSLKSRKDFVLPLPQLMSNSRMYHFTTPSAKRAKLTRKKEGLPYQMVLSAGGADVFLVHGFSGKVGGKDIFELYPGFHRANLALDGVSDPFMVKFAATIEKERRTASGSPAGVSRKEMFVATLRITPVDGAQPKLEFEYLAQGEKFIIRNSGKTKVEVDLYFLNTFDPSIESGDEDELNALREQLDLPNRKRIEKFVLTGSSSVEFTFDTWWNMKEGGVHISQNSSKPAPDGCSCNSAGHKSTEIPLYLLALIGTSLVLFRAMRKRQFVMLTPFVLLMGGCFFSPPPPEYLFRNELVVKFDLKKAGLCKQPLFVVVQSIYNTDWAHYFNYENFNILEGNSTTSNRVSLNETDEFAADSIECIVAISHINTANYHGNMVDGSTVEEDYGVTNYSNDYIPLRIHVKNICTLEEFHYQGDLPTYDIRIIPECQDMLDGWDKKSIPENCLRAIPATVTAAYTPSTDFDWSQYPQWEQYRDAFNCEDFQ